MSTGGKCSASAGVCTEVMTSHTNGKISTIVAGISTRCHGLNGSRHRRRAPRTAPPAGDRTPPRAGADVAVMTGNR
jgi:hypothetical protein